MKKKIIALFTLVLMCGMLSVSPKAQTLGFDKPTRTTGCLWKKLAEYSPQSFSRSVAVNPLNPNTVYAAIGDKLYKSENYGKTWKLLISARIEDIAIDYKNPKNVYILKNDGLYRSTDSGLNWTKLLSKNTVYCSIAIDPVNPKILYTGDYYGHIYKTTDWGNSWTSLTDLGSNAIYAISISKTHPNIIFASLISGLFKSVNSGQTWTKVKSESTLDVKINPLNDNIVYAISKPDIHHSYAYKSTNGGISWNKIISINYCEKIAIDTKNPNIMYVATWGQGIFKSVDSGQHWNSLNNGLQTLNTTDIVIDPAHTSVLYCITSEPNLVYERIYRLSCPVTQPTSFSAHFYGDTISFSWKYPEEADVDYFTIAYKKTGSSAYKIMASHIGKEKRTYSKTDFTTLNNSFDFIISAYMEDSHSLWSHDTARHLAKPNIISLKTVSNTKSGSKLKLSWNKASVDPQAEYIIVWRNNPNCSGYLCIPIIVKKIMKNSTDFNRGYIYMNVPEFNKKYTISFVVYNSDNGYGTDANSTYKTIFIPDAPKNFQAYANGNKIYLSWEYDASSAIDYFKIFAVSPHPTSIKTVKKTAKNTAIATSITGKITFFITAYKNGNFTNSESDEAYVLKTPDKPILTQMNEEIKIRWDENSVDSNANKIEVYRKTEHTPFALIATINKNQEEFTDSTVAANKTYYYMLKAKREKPDDHDDVSAPSQTNSIKLSSPNAPDGLSAFPASCTKVTLAWNDNSDNEENFLLERKEETESYTKLAELDSNTTFYIDNTVEEGKTYHYRLKATNGIGNSEYSNEVIVSVPVCEGIPNAPTDLEITDVETYEIELSWKDNSNNETGFKVQRKTENGNYEEIAVTNANKTLFSDKNISPGTTYYYRVKAFNKKGDSDYSNEVSITTKSQAVKKVEIKLQPDNEMMLVNGIKREIDPGRGTKPVIVKSWSRTVVPVRAIVEALGGTIEWNGNERKVTIKFNGNIIELWIDNPKAKVNGQTKWIDENNHNVKPIIINDRTMLPLRFVAENLGCKVEWDGNTRTITITYPES